MRDDTTSYTQDDLNAVTRYLVSLVASDREEHQAAFLAVLEGNPYARLVAMAHLTAGLLVESPTENDEAMAAVFALSGRVADALPSETEED